MSYCGGWRPHIESALCLDLRTLFKRSTIWPCCNVSGGWKWMRDDEKIANVGYRATLGRDSGTLTLDYAIGREGERKAITCTIALVTEPCQYGGRRWFMVCPYTRRRALKLYKWAGIELFCHPSAIKPKPTYASQRVSGSDRVMGQRWALRHKLGDTFSTLMDEPCKPKWMRWRTFERYAARDAELADREGFYLARLLGRLGVKEAAVLAVNLRRIITPIPG